MPDFTPDQLSVLNRIISRHKKMHMQITPFAIGLGMRANGFDLPLKQIKEWLAEHEAPEPTKPEIDFDPGVEKQELKENMAGNVQASKNWMDIDDEHSSGDYISFQNGVPKILKIVTNPIAGEITFKKRDGSTETNFGLKMDVLDGDNPEIKEWSVTSKQIRDQLKAIARRYGFPNGDIAGAIFKVAANGEGLQRKYWVELLQKPGQAASAPAYVPAANGQPLASQQPPADQGAAWLESQRSGMNPQAGAPAGGH